MMFTPFVGERAGPGLCAGLLSVIKVVEARQMRGSHHPESCRSVQYSAVQYSTVQYSTVQPPPRELGAGAGPIFGNTDNWS